MVNMKGGGSTDSTVTQTTTNLPEYAEPYVRDLLARTGYETSQPYQSYGGQRLAGFSPMEQEAMTRFGQLGVSGTPEELNFAGQVAGGIAGSGYDANVSTGRGSNYVAGPGNVSYSSQDRESQYEAGRMSPEARYWANQRQVGYQPGRLDDADMLARYSNPYMQNVVDVEKREASRQADIRKKNIGLTAAGIGSLGGYREGIERGENERNLIQQTGDIQTRGSERAFADAKASFEADRSARAQLEQFEQSQFGMNEAARQRQAELIQQGYSVEEAAQQAQEELRQGQFGMNSQNRQFGAQLKAEMYQASENAKAKAAELGLKADEIKQAGEIASKQAQLMFEQNRLQGAGMLGDFAAQRQGMEIERLGLMQEAGLGERGLMQQGLDIGYQDYLRQQAYPKEQLSFYSDMLRGNQIQPGQTQTVYGDQPTSLQSMLGTGIAGAGMYNAFRGGG